MAGILLDTLTPGDSNPDAEQGTPNAAGGAQNGPPNDAQNVPGNADNTADNSADNTSSGGGGTDVLPEINLLDEAWIAEFEDTTWIGEIGSAGRETPFFFFGNLLLDVSLGMVFFGVLWFLVERWATDTRAAIARRELWDEEQKKGELERNVLLRRYFISFAAFLGFVFSLGLFSLRYRVPILQPVALGVRAWLLDNGLSRIIAIVVVGAIIYSLLQVIRKTARAFTPVVGQRFERQVARAATIRNVIESAARLVLITFFILFVLVQVGIDVAPLLAGVGILGLAISFGAQSLVKDFITGFFILAEDQFGVGDVVTIGLFSGAVESLSLRVTTLRALDGSVHVIPNGSITQVTVASKEWSRSVVDIELAYGTDLEHALKVFEDEAVKLTRELGWSWRISGPPEVTGVEALRATGILIRVLFKTLPKEQWGVSREFMRRLKLRFDAEGIALATPRTTLYWGGGQGPEGPVPGPALGNPPAQQEPPNKPER